VKQSEERPLALVLDSSGEVNLQTRSTDLMFLSDNGGMPSFDQNRHRRVTSAAMVGLALSVGASDILSLWNIKGALAAETPLTLEPVQNDSTGTANAVAKDSLTIIPPTRQADDISFSSAGKTTPPAFDLADYYPEELYSHRVAPAETLWGIAHRYGIEAEVLASLNHLSVNSPLQVGQVLQFPRIFITQPINDTVAVNSAENKATVKSTFLKTGTNVKLVQKSSGVSNTTESSTVVPLSLQPASKKEDNMPVAFLPNDTEAQGKADVILADLMPYRVQSGDTLDKIARTYHVSRSNLMAVNQIENPNLLKVDQVIGVPRPSLNLAVAPSNNPSENSVPVLNSLKSSAVESGAATEKAPVSSQLASVLKQNPASFPYQPSNALSGELSYQVQPGDTLSKIARNHGVPMAALLQANPLPNPNVILVNQTLVIPQNAKASLAGMGTSVQVAVNPTAEVDLGQPAAPQVVEASVAVKAPRLQVNTAIIPTVPSLQSVVQTPIALPQPVVPVTPAEVPQVAIASPETRSLYTPDQGVKLPEASGEEQLTSDQDRISRLLSEVKVLREQYRQGKGIAPQSPVAAKPSSQGIPLKVNAPNPEVAAVPTLLPDSKATVDTSAVGTPQISSSDRINPEFNPQAYRTSNRPTATDAPPQLLAAASINPSQYEPLVQSLVGQTVSPALPSLSSTPYLPKDQTFAGYIWPTKGVLTSGFGWRWGRMHKGIDIASSIGTPVVAAAAGTVVSAGWNDGGYGYLVEIRHEDGSLTLYAHNSRILVREGQYVEQGQPISEMGSTGYSTGPHLHFEIHPSGQGAVNPMAYMPQ
jgi:murein DD-endopeptidase MepM/ murein hydrolase activator NlpD